MTTIADPIIGSWYKDLESKLKFKVIAIDKDDEAIEIQYLNCDIGEYDNDTWYSSSFNGIEAPEDWSAAFDGIETDDLGYTDTDEHKPNIEDVDIDDYLD